MIGRISRSNSRDVPSGVGTVAWKLQREIILLLGWSPAILLQVAHPLVARGVADHSGFRTERWGRMRRLYRTLDAMLGLCFKTEREALAVVARINAIHDRVNGRLTEAAGIFPAGTPYSAHDPNLLAWVHATLLDMNLRVYELFVTPLRIEEKDRYCVEASAIEGHLGIPEGRLPRSFGGLHRHVEAMLAGGEITVTDAARTLAHAVIDPKAPRFAEPALRLMRLTTVGLLPSTIREGYLLTLGLRLRRAVVGRGLAGQQYKECAGDPLRGRGSRQHLEGWLRQKTAPAPPRPKPTRPPRRPPPKPPAPPQPR
jgi:uncharacterized protein (DUF2236 family)